MSSSLQPPCCHRMLQSGSLFFELEHAKKDKKKKEEEKKEEEKKDTLLS